MEDLEEAFNPGREGYSMRASHQMASTPLAHSPGSPVQSGFRQKEVGIMDGSVVCSSRKTGRSSGANVTKGYEKT
jgi:hypothetical protein